MSRDGSILLKLAGRPQHFKLAIGEWMKLQDAFDVGPSLVVARFFSSEWKVVDLVAVLRFGLEGGGMSPVEAENTARDAVERQPLVDSLIVVQKILQVAYAGPVDEPPKNVNGGRPKATGSTTSRVAKSGSESSSAPPT